MKTVKQLCLSLSVCFGLLIFCNKAFSQAPPPPPAGGPPPPPPPSEVFKKQIQRNQLTNQKPPLPSPQRRLREGRHRRLTR
jgi:hypothetical protein